MRGPEAESMSKAEQAQFDNAVFGSQLTEELLPYDIAEWVVLAAKGRLLKEGSSSWEVW